MHAIGQLVMHAAMPEQALQVDKVAVPWTPVAWMWNASPSHDFADVGAELARRWRFPDDAARS
jgi:HD-like signal output (HDOD) protein